MITLALSKGRILKQTLPMLNEVGIELLDDPFTSRKLIFETNRSDVQCVILRATDVPTYVQFGAADLGIVGKDGLMEHEGDGLCELLDLQISKCRLMTAVRAEDVDKPRNQKRIRVASKYVKSAQKYYQERGIQAEIIKLYGAMELAPLVGLADQIVDLVDSGETLRANALREVEEINQLSARLISNLAALRMQSERIREIVQLIDQSTANSTHE